MLTLIITNRLGSVVQLLLNEKSFTFIYKIDEKHTNFGSMMMENKATREIIVKPGTKESILVSFVPLKPGLIEIDRIVLRDKLSNRKFTFECKFNLLID